MKHFRNINHLIHHTTMGYPLSSQSLASRTWELLLNLLLGTPRSIWRALLSMVIVVAIAFGIRALLPNKNASTLKTATLSRGDIRQTVSANGTLNPVSLISVGTQVSGTVAKLHADYNQTVKKGQLLLELDDALLSANLQQSQAQVMLQEANTEFAEAHHLRIKNLFEQKLVSIQDYDQSVRDMKSAKAQLMVAKAQVKRDFENVRNAKIYSPVNGVVIDRTVDIGQTVAASLQTPTLFKIAGDLTSMQIDSSFAEGDISQIREGLAVSFTVDAFPDRSFQGRVRQVRLNPTTQSNVVTYNVVINVENPDRVLMPGMTAYVSVINQWAENVLRLPTVALRYRPAEKRNDGALDKNTAEKGRKSPNDNNNINSEGIGSVNIGRGAVKQDKGDKNGKDTPKTIYIKKGDTVQEVSIQTGISDGRYTEVKAVVKGQLVEGDTIIMGEEGPKEEANKASSGGVRVRMF